MKPSAANPQPRGGARQRRVMQNANVKMLGRRFSVLSFALCISGGGASNPERQNFTAREDFVEPCRFSLEQKDRLSSFAPRIATLVTALPRWGVLYGYIANHFFV